MATPITTPLTTASGVRDVFIAEERYAIVATSGGIDVVDLFKGHVISSGTLPSEPQTIAVDWQSIWGRLYVGTVASGIFDMNYVLVRNTNSDFTDDLVQRFTTGTSPPVSDNQINDLDVLPGRLLVGTNAGIDFIDTTSTNYSTRPLVSGSKAVRFTTAGAYWTTNSGTHEGSVETNYDLLSTTGTSIIDVDFEYTNSSTPALPAEPPYDIAVSEVAGQLPAIGVATSGGTFVFEELQGNESATNNTLLTEEPVVSVDFYTDSYYTSGSLYTATSGIARIFDMSQNIVSAMHTPESGTRGMTVVTGTNTVIRTVDTQFPPDYLGAY